jgi:hypothetical protein
MNIISMMSEVLSVANPMIGKSALPDLGLATDQRAQRVRVCALDQLNGTLDGYVMSGSKQEMDMIGHEYEGVQRVTAFSTIVVKGLEE